ncbi:hypothetical protein [Robbsia sp. KACC 23696]|uniref:hypothetical protein n=1 Tax=Robbsia sp. KACC 23696 TaxID=3149231 RepID=UPI00325A6D7B
MEVMLRKKIVLLLACISFLPRFTVAQTDKLPMNRNDSLINAFEVMCNLELPNFTHIDAKATAMRMHVVSDVTSSSTYGAPIKRKGWTGSLTTGTFGLLADEVTGPKGVATSCGVVGSVGNAEAFRAAFLKQMKIAPTAQSIDPSGAPVIVWRDYVGTGTTLVFRTLSKEAHTTVTMALISVMPAK